MTKRVFGVKFMSKASGFYEGKEYFYLYSEGYEIGDIVAVNTKFGPSIVQITSEMETDVDLGFREILVNLTNQHEYFRKIAEETKVEVAHREMKRLAAELDDKFKYSLYADLDENFAKLFNIVYGGEK